MSWLHLQFPCSPPSQSHQRLPAPGVRSCPPGSQVCQSMASTDLRYGSLKPRASRPSSVLTPHEFSRPTANSRPAVWSRSACQRLQITAILCGAKPNKYDQNKPTHLTGKQPMKLSVVPVCCPWAVMVSCIAVCSA